MSDLFDVLIIGAGPSGLSAAYELSKYDDISICIIDKGKKSVNRSCNLINNGKCSLCYSCDLIEGIGGAGLFSDGKLSLSTRVGERLNGLSTRFNKQILKELNNIFREQGKIKPFNISKIQKIQDKILKIGLNFEYYKVKGIDYSNNKVIISKFENLINIHNVEVKNNYEVVDINKSDDLWELDIKNSKNNIIKAKYLIVGTGRSGSKWLSQQVNKFKIESKRKPFYIGVRVETKKHIMSPLTDLSYNPKITFGEKNRDYIKTHCFCEGGNVISYCYDDVKCVGGFLGKNDTTNFSILVEQEVPKNYTTYDYSHWICSLINKIGKNKIILQRYGDFIKKKETLKKDIINNNIQPSLKEYSYKSISSIFPEKIVNSISNFIILLDVICPGIKNPSTLIYAPSLEWGLDQIQVNEYMETNQKNLYTIGDGAGITQGIISAAATGLIAAKDIKKKIKGTHT